MTAGTATRRRKRFSEWIGGPGRIMAFARIAFSLLVFVLLWEAIARLFVHNRLILVPFSEVMQALWKEALNGALWTHSWVTVQELLVAFPVAVFLGMVTGIILAISTILRQTFEPIITAFNSIPLVALAPLLVAAFGFGITSKVIIIILISVFPVIASTDSGLRSADPALLEMARSFTASRRQILRTVTLPHALPHVISGIRVAFAKALVGAIVAEFFGSMAGMGFAILEASQNYQTARLLGYVMLLGALGLFASIGLEKIEQRLAPWKES